MRLRSLLIAALLFAPVNAWAQAAVAPTQSEDARASRLALLEARLQLVQREEVKAKRAHDAWLNCVTQPNFPGLSNSSLATGRADWIAALRSTADASAQLYPDQPLDLMTSPPAGLTATERKAQRDAAMPKIQGLIKRMTDEIAALRAGRP
jgi:hypothetical protein